MCERERESNREREHNFCCYNLFSETEVSRDCAAGASGRNSAKMLEVTTVVRVVDCRDTCECGTLYELLAAGICLVCFPGRRRVHTRNSQR